MKSKITFTDVGGIKGTKTFEVQRGRVNLIEGSNSGGKSSLVRGLIAVLSTPEDGEIKQFYVNEAVNLGVKTDPRSALEGFVHILAEKASVELEVDGKDTVYTVGQDGSILSHPDGDVRFMLAGVLSNQSKILRQLRGQDNDEPDDFRWAVSELSLATRYQEVVERLEDSMNDYQRTLAEAKQKESDASKHVKEKAKLEKQLAKIKREIDALKGQSQIIDELDSLINKREKRVQLLHDKKLMLRRRTDKSQVDRKAQKRLETEAKKLRSKFEDIDLNSLEEELNLLTNDVEIERTQLIEERSKLEVELNLFVVASQSLKPDGVECPLCKRGHLTKAEVETHLKELRSKRNGINDRLGAIQLNQRQKAQHLREMKEKRAKLKADTLEKEGAAKRISSDLSRYEAEISKRKDEIKEDQRKIKGIESDIEKLQQSIGEENKDAREAIISKDKKIQQIRERIGALKDKLYESEVDLGRGSAKPKTAIIVLNRWVEVYKDAVEYASEQAENQRKLAVSRFNVTVKGLLELLGFKEFRTVHLNSEYRLYIERYDEKKKDYVFQQVRTLSTSEQMSIALILQLALKDTYLPDIPFFIIDDVLEDFDETRREAVLGYLEKIASENDLFVITTKLVQGVSEVRVV